MPCPSQIINDFVLTGNEKVRKRGGRGRPRACLSADRSTRKKGQLQELPLHHPLKTYLIFTPKAPFLVLDLLLDHEIVLAFGGSYVIPSLTVYVRA